MHTVDINQKLYNILYETPSAIAFFKKRYQSDQLWRYCIERDPNVFGLMEDPSLDMCIYAIDISGENIVILATKFKHIKITKKIAYLALRTFPAAILYIPEDVLTEGMLDMAFAAKPSLISHFNNLPFGYYLRKVRENPWIIQHITDPREDLICAALEGDPMVCTCFKHPTTQMINIVKELNPELAQLYINSLESETDKDAKNSEEERQDTVVKW